MSELLWFLGSTVLSAVLVAIFQSNAWRIEDYLLKTDKPRWLCLREAARWLYSTRPTTLKEYYALRDKVDELTDACKNIFHAQEYVLRNRRVFYKPSKIETDEDVAISMPYGTSPEDIMKAVREKRGMEGRRCRAR